MALLGMLALFVFLCLGMTVAGIPWFWTAIPLGGLFLLMCSDVINDKKTSDKGNLDKKPSKEVSKKPVVSVRETKPTSTTKAPVRNTTGTSATNASSSYDRIRIKREFLEKVSPLTTRLVDCFDRGWASQKEKYEQCNGRVVFVGVSDLYIFLRDTPPTDVVYQTLPWPSTFWIGNKHTGYAKYDYTFYRYIYSDNFGIAPLKEYKDNLTGVMISEKEVTGWMTENLKCELKKKYPKIQVGNIELTGNGSEFYCYFSYTVPEQDMKALY